jgi:ATP-dependent RNA circularization protein (DNA/RNA ligase family)
MNAQQRLSLLVLSLAAARTAHADAVKDFKAGTVVKLDAGTIVAGYPRVASARSPSAKVRDSFDFTIAASFAWRRLDRVRDRQSVRSADRRR